MWLVSKSSASDRVLAEVMPELLKRCKCVSVSLDFNDSTSVMTPSSLMELKVICSIRNDLLVDRDDEKERIASCVNGVCKCCNL